MRTWLYLPNGCKYEFCFDPSAEEHALTAAANDYANALDYTNRLLALGASVTAPGLEAGEEKDRVLGVVKRVFLDETENREIPVIDVFVKQEHLGLRWVFKYLNNDEQIAEFEDATGLTLADIPVFTQQSLNRNEKPQLAKQYLIPVKQSCSVVRKLNPAYDPNAAKKKMQYHLVRWESVGFPTVKPPALPPPLAPKSAATEPPATVTPATSQNAGNGVFKHELQDIWNIPPSGAHWTRLRTWLLPNVYDGNKYELNGSLAKRAKETQNWTRDDGSQMTIGDIVTYLQTRHAGEAMGLKQASGQ